MIHLRQFRTGFTTVFLCVTAIASSSLLEKPANAQSGSLYRNPRQLSFSQSAGLQQQFPMNPQVMQPQLMQPYGAQGQGVGPEGWLPPRQGYEQQGPVYMPPGGMPPMMVAPGVNQDPLAAASWTFVPPTQARNLRVHDIISIRVSETAQSRALGNAQSRKNLIYDARLEDWIRMVGLDTLKPSSQSDGDQRIRGQENEVYRSSSDLQTREEITFNIAAEIADIRPNGNLVISAHKNIKLNDNDWEVALSGICRPQDVGPDNVVLSKDIIDLNVNKVERGHVRDGYSRGWFTRWLARFKPF